MFDVPEIMYLNYLEEQEETKNRLINLLKEKWDEETITYYNNQANPNIEISEYELKMMLLNSNRDLLTNSEYYSLENIIRNFKNYGR